MNRTRLTTMVSAALAAALPAFAMPLIFSVDLAPGDTYYTIRTTAFGELLVVNTNTLVATRMEGGKPVGTAAIATGGASSWSIDANWFTAQKNLQTFVVHTKSGSLNTYALYQPVHSGIAAPLGSFGNISTGYFSVAYYRVLATSVEETFRNATATSNRVSTYGFDFKQKVNTSIKAVFGSTPTNKPIVSFANRTTVQAEKGKDPVAGSTMYKYYTTSGSGLAKGSAPASKKLGLTVVYQSGSLYLYDQDNKKTLLGPLAVPGIASNETISGNYATSTNTIVLRIASPAGVELRKYAVNNLVRHTYTSKTYNALSTCAVYNKSRFLLVETNGVGSVVNKISANTLLPMGMQTCQSKSINATSDRYFIDYYTASGVRKVDAYGF